MTMIAAPIAPARSPKREGTIRRSPVASGSDRWKITSRTPADCGRNGLFGAKREWSKVGSDGAPVVCVSALDAEAYAAWLGMREKRRYRLPSAGELKAAATVPVSGWTTLCADNACAKRMASGKLRALVASRGYADVGIRLVRER